MYRQSGMKAIEVKPPRQRGQGNKYENDRGWRAEGWILGPKGRDRRTYCEQ
jgi:hypothetical protein